MYHVYRNRGQGSIITLGVMSLGRFSKNVNVFAQWQNAGQGPLIPGVMSL